MIELDPKNPRAYYNRGNAKQAKGDLEGAMADFNRAIELDPRYAEVRGDVLLAKGDRDGALKAYREARGNGAGTLDTGLLDLKIGELARS